MRHGCVIREQPRCRTDAVVPPGMTLLTRDQAPGPGCTLSWCVPHAGLPPTPLPPSPVSPVLGAVHRRTPHRQVKITCSMRTALLAGTPTTNITVTALTGALEGYSSRAGEMDRVRISARLRHSPRAVNWQRPWAVVSRHLAVIRVTPCDSARSRPLATLARLATVTAPLAMCITDGTANAAQQHTSTLRFNALGEWFQRRPSGMRGAVAATQVFTTGLLALPYSEP